MITEFENYKILLVDDDPDSIEFISYNLKKEGFRVYSVSNGIEAIKKARETIPLIILLDIICLKKYLRGRSFFIPYGEIKSLWMTGQLMFISVN